MRTGDADAIDCPHFPMKRRTQWLGESPARCRPVAG
jgi:hypothetical protein